MYKMNYSIRSNCILCGSNLSQTMFEMDKQLPVFGSCISSVDEDIKNDILIPYNVYHCEMCGIVQNKYLGNIDLIYKEQHNDMASSISMFWRDNYSEFVDCIINAIPNIIDSSINILEVGGGNNFIAGLVKEKIALCKYTILEPNVTEKLEQINYIDKFLSPDLNDIPNDYDLIILSHVLEHLYEFQSLFEKFTTNKYIAINIPNMSYYIDNMITNVLNLEHTFYYEEMHILALFKNFKMISRKPFRNHSIFYIFERQQKPIIPNYSLVNDLTLLKSTTYFSSIDKYIGNVNTIIDGYIRKGFDIVLFPCNIYLQYMYMFGLDITNVKYCYDNNSNKSKKRLYGTHLLCLNLQDMIQIVPNPCVLLFPTSFTKEVVKLLEENNVYHVVLTD